MSTLPIHTKQPASWGAVFDWDGVVIDSSLAHEEGWVRLAAELGRELPDGHFKKGFGRKNEFIIPQILRWTEDPQEISLWSLRKEALYREVIRERGLAPLPGVRPFLERLRHEGVPCAIGSSTHKENLQLSLELIDLAEFFSGIVTAEDVSHGKPDPEVFLKAAEKIGRPPERCVVFEDAHVGIEAARAAGMRVIGVATTHPLAELGKADTAVERLDGIAFDQFYTWFGQNPTTAAQL